MTCLGHLRLDSKPRTGAWSPDYTPQNLSPHHHFCSRLIIWSHLSATLKFLCWRQQDSPLTLGTSSVPSEFSNLLKSCTKSSALQSTNTTGTFLKWISLEKTKTQLFRKRHMFLTHPLLASRANRKHTLHPLLQKPEPIILPITQEYLSQLEQAEAPRDTGPA